MTDKKKMSLFIRLLIVSTIAVMDLSIALYLLSPETPNLLHEFHGYLDIIIAYNLVSEGTLLIDKLLKKRRSWIFFPLQRLLLQIGLTAIWVMVLSAVYYYLLNDFVMAGADIKMFILTITLGLMFTMILSGIVIAKNFFTEWKNSFFRNEQLQREKLKSDYQVLQNQLNPHFLFNSLNVLISEIRYNPDSAVTYAEKLSDMYRYVLQSKNRNTVSLKTELEFIDTFIFIQKVRMDKALCFTLTLDEEMLDMELPPLSIQIPLENAIKHNIASASHPLNIEVTARNNAVIITNNYQPKKTAFSTGTGLENLNGRMEILTGKSVDISRSDSLFSVTLPLIG